MAEKSDSLPQLTLEQYERMFPRADLEHEGVKMRFMTPNTFTLWRVRSIYEKEPWTLEWIAGFSPGEVFLDCGANVGMYTIWAAATRQVNVYAFEPESQNYAVLNRNILANDLSDKVHAYCMALSDETGLSTLHMADLRIGGSNHSLGEALDFKHEPMGVAFQQGCVSGTIDDLVARGQIPVPNHIKIDVDGFEPKVIAGAAQTLERTELRSLLIETNQNLEDHLEMVKSLNALGFAHDAAQVARAERKDGTFKGVAEYVFRR
jgi:FkbM family methyltransferase